jgi:ferrous iron transport protein A
VKTLADLRQGVDGIVQEVSGQDAISMRLMEMGIVPGTKLRLITVAPLGDPLEFELRGFRLSLRKTEAARVSITTSQ